MDKLELDSRMACLERRVASLTLLTALLFAGAILSFVMVLRQVRSAEAMSWPMPPTPPMPVRVETAPAFLPPLDASQGTVGHLVMQIGDLGDLHNRGVVNDTEFQAKKAQLLSHPMVSKDMRRELEEIGRLRDQNLLTSEEFDLLKAQALDLKTK